METHMFFLLWIFVMPYFTDTTTAKGTVQNYTNSFNYTDTLTIHYKHWLMITEHYQQVVTDLYTVKNNHDF